MHSKSSSFALIAALLAAGLLLAGCGGGSKTQVARAGGMPPVPVSVAVAARQPVPTEIHSVGNVEPYTTVQVKSNIAGELMKVHFAEGADVAKGQLLFEIDRRPFAEALKQAQAAEARDEANLRQAQANLGRDQAQLKNAEADAARYGELLKQGVISRQQYDQVRTNADALRESARADQAAIESYRASIDSDKAAVDRAKLDLTYCEIRSPISGRTGNLLVHPGNLVKANDTALVVINQVQPIFVSFGVPESHLARIRARSAGGARLTVEAAPSDANTKAVQGYLAVIDNTADPSTGTIRLKAVFDNAQHVLWPGQFANVVLKLETADRVVVPQEAVQAGQQGQFVYVVKSDQSVDMRPVSVGAIVAGKVVIDKGVAEGDTVVTDGQLRLFPGAHIQAVPSPANEPPKG